MINIYDERVEDFGNGFNRRKLPQTQREGPYIEDRVSRYGPNYEYRPYCVVTTTKWKLI